MTDQQFATFLDWCASSRFIDFGHQIKMAELLVKGGHWDVSLKSAPSQMLLRQADGTFTHRDSEACRAAAAAGVRKI